MDQSVSIEKIRAATGGPPDVVKAMAERLSIGKHIAEKLMTDDGRMDSVWRELRRWPVDPSIVERLAPQVRLRTYDISIANRSPQDQAIAALFAFCVIELGQDRKHGTVKDAQRLAQLYLDNAVSCRSMMSVAPHPPPEVKHALEISAAYFEDWARSMLAQAESGPYFAGVIHSKLGTEPRARFRTLTAAIHAIYGKKMPHTVATMLSVALDITISRATADEWSSDLLPSSWVLEPPPG